MMKIYSDLLQNALPLVTKVGKFIHNELGNVSNAQIEEKSLNSLVSYVDKTAEEQLVEGLQHLLPPSTFLTEEETIATTEGEWQWIIDPLDGTTNFLHQLPHFSVSVGLKHQGKLVVGIVYDPCKEELFYAHKDGGAFLNQRPIQVSNNTKQADALIATGFPYYDYDRQAAFLKSLAFFMKTTRGIRRFGSAALDLAYVAAGRYDLFFEYSLSPWDVAGGALIVQEAGGIVTDFSNGDNYLFGEELIAANSALHTVFQQHIQSFFE